MAGSIVVAARQGLVALVQARPEIETGGPEGGPLQVSYAYPGDDVVEKETIFTGRSRAEHNPTALKVGRRFRAETATFDVLVQVRLDGDTAADTEARAFEWGLEVEEAVADDYTLGGVVGLNWALVSAWDLNTGLTDIGHLTQLIYTIRYNARLT
jgi:hypothetical protein